MEVFCSEAIYFLFVVCIGFILADGAGTCEPTEGNGDGTFFYKGDSCSLSCGSDHVLTDGPPEYTRDVSRMYTCTHNTSSEWQGAAECTPRTFRVSNIHVLSYS